MGSLSDGYHRKQTKAKQNEETIKMHIDLAIYLFKKNLVTGDSLLKNILGVFVLACPETLLTTRITTFAYKMKKFETR